MNKKLKFFLFLSIWIFLLFFSCDFFIKLNYGEWFNMNSVKLPVFVTTGSYSFPIAGTAQITLIGGGGGGAGGIDVTGNGGSSGFIATVERQVGWNDTFSVEIGTGGGGGIAGVNGLSGSTTSITMLGGEIISVSGGSGGVGQGGTQKGSNNTTGYGGGGDGGAKNSSGNTGSNGVIIIRIMEQK